jgi:hypothetical protein
MEMYRYVQNKTQKNFFKNLFSVGILKATCTEEKGRIRIRIRQSVVRICGSGSAPKCHGSTKLEETVYKTEEKKNE